VKTENQLKRASVNARKHQRPRAGAQARANVEADERNTSEKRRELKALVFLSTGMSVARVAAHEDIRLQVVRVQVLADAWAYAERKAALSERKRVSYQVVNSASALPAAPRATVEA
jgi:hypothetical protein